MLTQPKREWNAINGEFANAPAIFRGYVVPVSAIGPIAALAGTAVFGQRGTLFGMVETSLGAAVQDSIAHYLLGLASVWVLAVALEFLAPYFGGAANRVQALKVVAYGSTPAWVCGILGLVPLLAPYSLLGFLWTLALIAGGAPILLKAQGDQAKAFGLVAAVATAIVALIFEGLARAFG
jgi:hypothetical protein